MGQNPKMPPFANHARRLLVDKQAEHVIGTDPKREHGLDDMQSQLFEIGKTCRAWFDNGYNPATLISGLMTMACYFADNVGVDREELHRVIREAHVGLDRRLEFRRDGG